MGWLALVGTIFRFALLIFKRMVARDAEKKKRLKEAEKDVKEGIKKRDPSLITRGFDRASY